MWDKKFEGILRAHLPFLPADTPLKADDDLRDLGLDSLGTVEMLASLESTYGVRFIGDALRIELFSSPESIWKTLNGLLEPV
jgi:acyl carrier protein